MLKRQSPDINAINVNYEMFKKSVNEFETYFLGTKDFVGGTDLNISGAQSFTTFLMADFLKNLNKVMLHILAGVLMEHFLKEFLIRLWYINLNEKSEKYYKSSKLMEHFL